MISKFNAVKFVIHSFAYGEYGMRCCLSLNADYMNVYLPQHDVNGPYMSNVDLNVLRAYKKFEDGDNWLVKQFRNPFDLLPDNGSYNEVTHLYHFPMEMDERTICNGNNVKENFLRFLREINYTGCLFIFSVFVSHDEEDFFLNIMSQKGVTSTAHSSYPIKLTTYKLGKNFDFDSSGAKGYHVDQEKKKSDTKIMCTAIDKDLFGVPYLPYILKYEDKGVKIKEVSIMFDSFSHLFKSPSLTSADEIEKRRITIIHDAVRNLVNRNKNIVYLRKIYLVKLIDERYQLLVHYTRDVSEERPKTIVKDISFV
ncbi:putative 34-kDa protein a [Citrus virus B]|nr:putative 34-kDa protein a [Citrus virus B]